MLFGLIGLLLFFRHLDPMMNQHSQHEEIEYAEKHSQNAYNNSDKRNITWYDDRKINKQ